MSCLCFNNKCVPISTNSNIDELRSQLKKNDIKESDIIKIEEFVAKIRNK